MILQGTEKYYSGEEVSEMIKKQLEQKTKEVEILEKCMEFYEGDNFEASPLINGGLSFVIATDEDCECHHDNNFNRIWKAGKLARETKAELLKLRGEK